MDTCIYILHFLVEHEQGILSSRRDTAHQLMAFFKYGFIFLAGAGFGAAMAHRGQRYCHHHRHGHCWGRRWSHRGGHELEPAPASYQHERRRDYFGPHAAADRDKLEEEGERYSLKKAKKSAASD
ncbi:hypothetical protein ACP70R_003368 [Stipagrostis hirtigluma subsp. patula]